MGNIHLSDVAHFVYNYLYGITKLKEQNKQKDYTKIKLA
ncbi:hypothetical protein RV02_GL001028 [Enterococcus gilvus]|nr:hypothetical protein RV02_GL001028 [Enterococcus gilvus]